MSLKDQILELKRQGKTYNQIQEILGCSKGTISFHCNPEVKERTQFRNKCYRNGENFERKTSPSITRCLYCDNKLNKSGYSYCDISCHKNHKFDIKYRSWLEGEVGQTRAWIRKALAKLHGYKCHTCGLSEWNNNSITLEVEHKDGCPLNNNIENLCLICPNCHYQTDSFRGGNKGKGRGSLGMNPFSSIDRKIIK